ncbi:MAG: nuclear transport factor 2 family protein [Candidatus Poribacteria bacterium]|nr:nuclear transport factor 2 family protein [Candidatus Poribacteria bacterium]
MRPKAIYYFFVMLFVTGMIGCGGDEVADSEPAGTKTPATTTSQPAEPTVVERNIDFAAEEEAIRDLYAVYATAHGEKDVDTLGDVWLKKGSDDVFTAWTFWAGTFERNNGWQDVNDAWEGIFRLRAGAVTVDISYIAIDARGKEAVLRGAYKWGNQQGDLISALEKDGSDWKIRAIDYTGGKNGKQVKDLNEPAYTFGEIEEE